MFIGKNINIQNTKSYYYMHHVITFSIINLILYMLIIFYINLAKVYEICLWINLMCRVDVNKTKTPAPLLFLLQVAQNIKQHMDFGVFF